MGDTGDAGSDANRGWPLSHTRYQPLVRLAALLTGDAQLAEAVAADSCNAVLRAAGLDLDSAEALRRLQREIVTQSRRAMRQRHAQARANLTAADPVAGAFATLPVVTAMRVLPARAREALVLIYYLDLTEQQAAVVAGVSLSSLRRNLAAALQALPADLPG